VSLERDDPADQGGDPVCWLHELCPVCGAVPSPEVPDRCWRCGAPRDGPAEAGDREKASSPP
jgi:hypothetical protein